MLATEAVAATIGKKTERPADHPRRATRAAQAATSITLSRPLVAAAGSIRGASHMLCGQTICLGRTLMLKTKLVTWALGIWAAISFVVCVIYGLVTPQSLHMGEFLEMVLPAFKWLTWWGFLLGLVESFLYGAYAGLVYCPIYNWLHRRWGAR